MDRGETGSGPALRTDAHEWVSRSTGQALSPLAKQVCDVLAFAGHGGIYNRPISFNRVDWTDNFCIELNWNGAMSNWDFAHLTAIWAHCADKMIRFEIAPSSPRHLRLRFWQRHARDGSMAERLPTALAQIRHVSPPSQGDTGQ